MLSIIALIIDHTKPDQFDLYALGLSVPLS